MIITADEIHGRMENSAFDFAVKKPFTHTLMMTISKEISKKKNLKASKSVHEREL